MSTSMVVTDNWCVYFVVASAVCQPYRIHDSQEACHDGLTLDGVMTIYDASRLATLDELIFLEWG